jgi:uncharacterized protein DUF4255
MSNSLTIATVTEALRQLLQAGARDAGFAGAEAMVLRPSSNLTGGHPTGHATVFVGLYPYQITPNTHWRNTDVPNRRSDGSLVKATRSPYDLYFLVTCYGDDIQFEPQRVLGALLRRLAAEPILTKAMIKDATFGVLADNNLDTEVESIKFSLLPLSLEEFSKLWSVFFQTTYTISIALQASVLFIDGKETPGPALPVRSRNLYVRPIYQPVIEQVLSQKTLADPILSDQPIVAGDILVLSGKGLRGEVTRVSLNGLEITPADVSDVQIKAPLTAPPFPVDSLRAGVLGVQVVHQFNMGMPATPHEGFESNVAAFVLRPAVTVGTVTINSSTVIDTVTYKDVTIGLNLAPKIGVDQRLVLLLNEYNPPLDRVPRAFRFEIKLPDPPPDALSHVDAPVKGVAAGKYLLRVQVDGAESLLDPGPDPAAPKYSGPLVTI